MLKKSGISLRYPENMESFPDTSQNFWWIMTPSWEHPPLIQRRNVILQALSVTGNKKALNGVQCKLNLKFRRKIAISKTFKSFLGTYVPRSRYRCP